MVVFDLDDTLYKEADYVASGCRAVADAAAQAGLLEVADAYRITLSPENPANRFDRLIAAIAARNGREAAEAFNIAHILNIYRQHLPSIELPESSRRLLDGLQARSVKMGIITDGRSFGQWAKINALGLTDYCSRENILISEEHGHDKHSPDMFQLMMERNPAESQFVYIGDNPKKDFYWPNKLGWQTVMLLDNGRNIHNQAEVLKSITSPDFLAQTSIADIALILFHNQYYVK
jgi:putative hydrolase of the HAD superfamily